MARQRTDFTKIKCCICEKGGLTSTTARREYDTNGNWTKRWFCNSCGCKHYKYGTADKEKISRIHLNYQKSPKVRYHNRTECEKIIKVGFSRQICRNNFHGDAFAEKGDNGNSTGKWICRKCYNKDRYNRGKTNANIRKALSDTRLGTLDPNSNKAKGDNFEELTSIWKGVKILGKENDCYNGPLDHSVDFEGKVPQTKGKLYDSYNRSWSFGSIEKEWDKEFDYEICYCASKDGKKIERIYIFPKEEIKDKRTSITIQKNPIGYRGIAWYEKYRIIDEETIKKVNDIWKEIISTSAYPMKHLIRQYDDNIKIGE